MLKAIESAGIRGLKEAELKKAMVSQNDWFHDNNNPLRFGLFYERRRDEASHYILRLTFCGAVPNDNLSLTDSDVLNFAEDGRRWFVNQEVSLLRYRLLNFVTKKEQEEFINSSMNVLSQRSPNLIRPMTFDEKESLMDQLRAIHSRDVLEEEFFNVAWEIVPDLVGKRGVILHRGRAFVPRSECLSIVLNRFKEELEVSLALISREIPFLRDDRIVPLLDALRRSDYSLDVAMSSSTSSNLIDQLTASDIDKASVHFPLCMQNLHRNLRADRHLKFNGRQQYGLFLKSIGLSLSEALIFWRTAFLPKHSTEQFNKDYAYNVRHNYGQEGKRANYTSYSCGKICGSAAVPGEYHGCPFKHSGSSDRLSNLLSVYTGPGGSKLNQSQIIDVTNLAKDGHYQLACTRVFELTRPIKSQTVTEIVTYPHKFYETSVMTCASKKDLK